MPVLNIYNSDKYFSKASHNILLNFLMLIMAFHNDEEIKRYLIYIAEDDEIIGNLMPVRIKLNIEEITYRTKVPEQRNLRWTALQADSENEELVDEYKKQRALTAIAIRNTKDSYYYKEFQKCVKKPKKMWNLINDLSKNNLKTVITPSKLVINSKLITDSIEICEELNKYFSTIGTILANQIPFHSHYTQKNTTSCSSADTTKPSLFSLEPCSFLNIYKTGFGVNVKRFVIKLAKLFHYSQ
ncbi:unnamed protein product [Leptidea sinapis]|uniref:Uncharacterized protein n=1 Tax=Leptidea sinapis TaxID=189913 RepID=A0A5E4QVF4_9NEOP|nr:unnamed protein product [Leptidea sinapis]